MVDPTGTYSFTFDNLGRLTGTTTQYTFLARSFTTSYTYDAVGNRLTSVSGSYTNNTSNEMTASPTATYTYDYNGNTTSKTNSTGTTNFTWDFENRLTSVTLPTNGGTVSFAYDPFGRRIKKVTPSTTSIYAYDVDNLVEETNSAGAAVARYAQTQNIDEPLALLRSGARVVKKFERLEIA